MKKVEFIEKEKRNKSLYRYHLANPDTTLEDIGKIYHISKARVSRIIIRIEKRKEDKGCAKTNLEGCQTSSESTTF